MPGFVKEVPGIHSKRRRRRYRPIHGQSCCRLANTADHSSCPCNRRLVSVLPTICAERFSDSLSAARNYQERCKIRLDNRMPTCISAAFDHSNLLEGFFYWFRFRDIVDVWITSYLYSRTFPVSKNVSVSCSFIVSYGIPQGFVLGLLIFLLYTTPLSHLVQARDVSRHLFADGTQSYI